MGIRLRSFLLIALAVAAIGLLTALRVRQLENDPRVSYLREIEGGEWIRAHVDFSLYTYYQMDLVTVFRRNFLTLKPVSGARLTLYAMRRCAVKLDEETIYEDPPDFVAWQQPRQVRIPEPLSPGAHRLRITVANRGGHPCLLAFCDELDVRTDTTWMASVNEIEFSTVILTTDRLPPAVALAYPKVWDSFRILAPWLLGVFVPVFAWTLWTGRPSNNSPSPSPWRLTPGRLRWLLMIAWIVLGANNLWRVIPIVGFDVNEHLKYVQYIAEHRALPLATDGWQMFQSPLFYLMAAPFYSVMSIYCDNCVTTLLLRVLPLLCGLAQIEIIYRSARLLWPEKLDLQAIATVVGGLLPMNIYISQFIGNEPLAGCLSALVLLLCWRLLVLPSENVRARSFVVLGLVWGLALLSKVTPALLALPVVLAVVSSGREGGTKWARAIARVATVFAVCFVTCGWYYIRNWIELGKPFAGGWDPATGQLWWQDPSYRTWDQLASFGASLRQPVYSGDWSLWDSLYSSMWADGFISGVIAGPERIPWNVGWMGVGTWLGVVPLGLMIFGAAIGWRTSDVGVRRALMLAVATIVIYLAAVIDLYLRLPVYSTAKATYTLGVLPCYALLVGAGAEPFLRLRPLRALIFATIACWAVTAYLTFFCVR